METRIDEIADRIYRISTSDPTFTFNQFLIDTDEPLLFHTGMRALFPAVSEAVSTVMPVEKLRWITFGHVEADESGSMNQWLAVAPNATVAHGMMACMVQVNDLADREPRPLQNGEVIDLGSHRVRNIDTPHVPHGWDAHVLYEETTGTLFTGDLFTAGGTHPVSTTDDIVEPTLAAEAMFLSTALTPATAPTIRSLADLRPQTLALMHGPAFTGDTGQALNALADAYGSLFNEAQVVSQT